MTNSCSMMKHIQRIHAGPEVQTFLPVAAPSQLPADDRVQSPEILLLPYPNHEPGSLSATHTHQHIRCTNPKTLLTADT